MGEKSFQPRNTAVKCRISDIITGRFVKGEGFESNFVDSIRGPISRVNIIAVIISVNNDSITIDDGSERIRLVGFDNSYLFQNKEIGDIVMVIGKPRMFSNELYIYPEIIKKVDKKWIEFRKKELGDIFEEKKLEQKTKNYQDSVVTLDSETKSKRAKEEKQKLKTIKKELELVQSTSDEIIEIVKRLDKGDGADVCDITKEVGGSNIEENIIEEKIRHLIKTGELFEIRRGRLKVLE
ncbi:MAG: OB-fold nucleic acid binding domain-containing protein [Candidatus Woesearchaeota archaeon]